MNETEAQQKISADIADFLRKGGVIEQVPQGMVKEARPDCPCGCKGIAARHFLRSESYNKNVVQKKGRRGV